MKSKIVLNLSCLLLFTLLINGQNSFYGGLGGGYYSTIILGQQNYGQRDQAADTRFSVTYSALLGIDFNNQHLIQIDPGYLSAGANYKPSDATRNLDRDISINYLHIPLTYRYVINGGSNGLNQGTRFFIGAGPYFNFLLSVQSNTFVNDNKVSFYEYLTTRPAGGGTNPNIAALNTLIPNRENPNFKDLYNSLDFGAMLVLGGQSFLSENFKLTYEIRAGVSASDINAEPWRLPNFDGNYDGSRNLFGGLFLGLNYYF